MTWRDRVTPPEVVVYTRRGCGLCAAAEALAADEVGRARLRLVDVDEDPDLQRRYNLRVPVVAVDGDEVAEVRVPPGLVARAVRHATIRRLVRPD